MSCVGPGTAVPFRYTRASPELLAYKRVAGWSEGAGKKNYKQVQQVLSFYAFFHIYITITVYHLSSCMNGKILLNPVLTAQVIKVDNI